MAVVPTRRRVEYAGSRPDLRVVGAPPGEAPSDLGRGPPEFPEACVPRPRLVARLRDLPDAPLAMIVAPAGYGKTTLLAEWCRDDERPFAWLTLGERHDDPELLVAEIADALEQAVPPDVGAVPAFPRGPGSTAAMLSALARSMASRRPFALVLDDVHVIRSAGARQVLRAVVRHVPRGARLALASRTEPSLPVARLRAHRLLVDIAARDLALTTSEGFDLLRMAGIDLARCDQEQLLRLTEGWPVGLYLAAVSLKEQAHLRPALRRVGGDDVVVADYLRDEVLAGLPVAWTSFLRRASVLDELSGPVCDAVLRRRGSARLLNQMARASVPLVPLDRTGGSYRLHALFREMLRGELRRLEGDRQRELHRRASDWLSAHGDRERAVEHAVAGRDPTRVGDLLAADLTQYVERGRGALVQRWLCGFTADQIASHPALALAAANSHLALGDLDAARHWGALAERSLSELPRSERARDVEAGVAVVRAAVTLDGVVRMGQDIERAYELAPEGSAWRPHCCLLTAVARQLTGDRDAARRTIEEGVRLGAVAAPSIQTLCLAQLALLAADDEDWETAWASVARATAQVEHYRLTEYPTSALVFAASAWIRARRGRLERAHDDARHAARLLGALTDFAPWYEAETRVVLARAQMRLGNRGGVRELLAEARRFARRDQGAIVLQSWIESAALQLGRLSASTPNPPLTAAELRVLQFLPTHLSLREISARLYVSPNTVKTHAHSVYRKLEASSRSEAVGRATGLGLLDPSA